MDAWTWALAGFAVYWAVVAALRSRGLLPESVGTMGPVLTVHTQRGKRLLDRLAAPKRLWRAWGNFGLGVALVVLVGSFLLLVVQAVSVLRNPPAPSVATQPQNVLVIPGVNEFLPLAVAPEILFGLLAGMIVHEGGHGLLCRVEDIEIESMGVALLAVLPIGAFVEPDEASQRAADRGSRARMFAAGVTNNFLLTVLAFGLLFGPVAGSIVVADGAAVGGVLPNSAAATAGIQQGDRIVAVGGHPVSGNDELDRLLATEGDRTVTVSLADGTTTSVTRSLLVTRMAADSPFAEIGVNATITAVNGTPVHTETDLARAFENRTVATLQTAGGTETTAPVGALVVVLADEPAAAAGLPTGETVVVTEIGGDRVVSRSGLTAALAGTQPGDTVAVEAFVDGERRTVTVTLAEQADGSSFLGVQVYPGYSGMTVSDFGTTLYPAGDYLTVLRGEAAGGGIAGFLRSIVLALMFPFVGAFGGLGFEYNFAGFVGWNAGFYEVTGPLAGLGGATFLLANLLFWTGWINLNLGFFNCIPAFPLDGGHLLRMGAEALVSRLPISDRQAATRLVTTSVGLVMLASLLLMVFGPQLLN